MWVMIGVGGGEGPNLAVLRGVAVPADPAGELLGPGEQQLRPLLQQLAPLPPHLRLLVLLERHPGGRNTGKCGHSNILSRSSDLFRRRLVPPWPTWASVRNDWRASIAGWTGSGGFTRIQIGWSKYCMKQKPIKISTATHKANKVKYVLYRFFFKIDKSWGSLIFGFFSDD